MPVLAGGVSPSFRKEEVLSIVVAILACRKASPLLAWIERLPLSSVPICPAKEHKEQGCLRVASTYLTSFPSPAFIHYLVDRGPDGRS